MLVPCERRVGVLVAGTLGEENGCAYCRYPGEKRMGVLIAGTLKR